MKRAQTPLMRQVVEAAGRCELCGSRRDLQAHHIIPVSMLPDSLAETEDNLICVCKGCHAKLTPTALLTKIGIKRTQQKNTVANIEVAIKRRIYELIRDKIEEYGSVCYDIFYEAIDEARL